MNEDISVPIVRIPFDETDREQIHAGIDDILNSGMLTQGEYTRKFEQGFESLVGAEHAVACNSGTSAIELILRGLGIEGKSIIVPTNTFMATAYGAVHAGNRVIFADSNPDTFGLDPNDVRRRIEADTAAIIVVHIGGIITHEIGELLAICDEHDIALIEDAAHAHGSSIDGRQAGTIGVAGAFSFYPTKVLTTGEGGIVTTNDNNLAERIRMVRNHGKNPERSNAITAVGSNWRMSEFTAAVGVQQLDSAQERIRSRQNIASYYDEHLPDIPGIEPLELPPGVESSYYKYIVNITADVDRDDVKRRMLEEHNVTLTGEVYADLCHLEPVWEDYTYCGATRNGPDGVPACQMFPECGCDARQVGGFEGAAALSGTHVCLPIYPGLSSKERNHVVESVRTTMRELVEGNG